MAASIKISELNSLASLTDVDLFLVSDMESGTSKKVSYSSLKSSVTSDVSSALTSLTTDVAQNKTDAETLVETVRAALQAAVDANAAGFAAGDSSLDTRVDVLEADPTTQTALDTQVATLNTAITNLTSTVDALDIDIAPATLDSINELAAAMGDDPNFLAGKLDVANPVFTGIIIGPDIDIGNGNLTVAGSGGVVSNVGFFSSGMLSIGGNASFTGNATFSGGTVNLLNGFKISNTAVTASADELNYVVGVTSDIQTQITALQTSIDNLDIDIAPETLNSIDELAAALGDNPNIIPNLQAELTAYKAEIEDRNLQLALAYDTPLFVELLNVA